MTAYCLADLFNLDLWPSGRRPRYHDVRDGIGELVDQTLRAVPSASEVTLRAYGGWEGDIQDTHADLRQMVMRAMGSVPKRKGRQRLMIEIANHPVWDRSIRLRGTIRLAPLHRIRSRVSGRPANCVQGEACPLDDLRSWFRGRCPAANCSTRLSDVTGQRHRQKMVDTLLTADAITIAHHGMADAIVLASDDYDMVPALLALLTSSLKITYLRRNLDMRDASSSYFMGIFEREGVEIRRWQS